MAKSELYHHGVEGQKWGIRNGPPYPLSTQKKSLLKKSKSKEEQAKKARSLSDSDLEALVKRLETEKKYIDLTYKKGFVTYMGEWMKTTGSKTLTNVVSKQASEQLNKIISNALKKSRTP